MRYLLLLFQLTFLCKTMDAQIGFSHSFDFGQLAIGWGSLVYSNDTVTVFGTIRENDQPAFGLLFSQFDTSGNLLQYKVYNDPEGDNTVLVYPNSFIKLTNGKGYAGIGGIFERKFGILALYDLNGSIRKVLEYPDAIQQDFYTEIVEVPDGFFILGQKQNLDYHTNMFLLKTDPEGHKLWEKSYGDPIRDNYYGSIVKVNDNEFVIGGATTNPQTQPEPVMNTSIFYVIDSLGNIKSSWQSQLSLTDVGVGFGMYQTEQKGWIYSTIEARIQPDGFVESKLCFIERDSNYNLVNRKTYGDFHNRNLLRNLKKLNNGDYLMLGSRVVHFDPPAQFSALHMGSLLRISPSGDSLWNFVDTAFAYATNTIYDAVELPSGSIIACGYSRTTNPYKDWGWIIKVNQNGCIDTLNCTEISAVHPVPQSDPLKIYPNPATDFIYLDFSESKALDYEVFDLSGHLILQGVLHGERLDIRMLKPGAYLLKIREKGRVALRKLIKM